jgi:hypothetical protein
VELTQHHLVGEARVPGQSQHEAVVAATPQGRYGLEEITDTFGTYETAEVQEVDGAVVVAKAFAGNGGKPVSRR